MPPPFVKPVDRFTLTSSFGRRWGRLHAGLDFASAPGTPVRAVTLGEVVEAGWSGGYGRLVRVRHRDGVVTVYAHLSAIHVPVAGRVRAGDVIGRVGSTGSSTGPHLHFEVRTGETATNPLPWLRRHGIAL